MYLFTSAIFFLIFFSLFKLDEKSLKVGFTRQQLDKMDTAQFNSMARKMNNGILLSKDQYFARQDSGGFTIAPGKYKTKEEYDSVLRLGKKHNWFERQMVYKNIELNEKYNHNAKQILLALINKFLHSIPQMLFILLPLFALVLKLLYIRRKNFYYVDHAIFTLHFYIFVFIDMLVIFGINKLKTWLNWQWLSYVVLVLTLAIFFYLYKAMRNFYKQRRAKTIFKYLLLLLMVLLITSMLFVAFLFLSIFSA
jgi:hypothetical protein